MPYVSVQLGMCDMGYLFSFSNTPSLQFVILYLCRLATHVYSIVHLITVFSRYLKNFNSFSSIASPQKFGQNLEYRQTCACICNNDAYMVWWGDFRELLGTYLHSLVLSSRLMHKCGTKLL